MQATERIVLGGFKTVARGFALVDSADFEWLSQWRWSLGGGGYAERRGPNPEKQLIRMHRQILGLVPGDGLTGDHINGNKLDNRRANLRVCSQGQNTQNVTVGRGRSHHRGVYFRAESSRWYAQVRTGGRAFHGGTFDTEEEAAEVALRLRREHLPFSTS